MFRVAFDQGFDERSFPDLRTLLGCAGGFNAQTHTGGAHDGHNDGGCLLR